MKLSFFFLVWGLAFNAFAYPIIRNAQALPDQEDANFTDYNFEGIVALGNCSGSLFRYENSLDTDKALVLTNGHCFPANTDSGFLEPGQFVQNVISGRSFTILSRNAGSLGRIKATKVLYATMTGTDIAIYETNKTYGEIQQAFHVPALILDSQHPQVNEDIVVISGFWRRGYSCKIEAFVYELLELGHPTYDSIRYSAPGCETKSGTSGSPVISPTSRKIIGINNTGNEDGERCTENNPCEVDANGQVTVRKGRSYAQQTHQIYTCLNADRQIDLSLPGCALQH